MIGGLLFDWGNTVMVDFELPGPMYNWEKVSWIPGAEHALQELSVSYPCYIATNAGQSDEKAVRLGLARIDAEKYFSGIFTSSDLGFEKPDPRFFESIISRLNIAPGQLVMIGDNYVKDIEGAGKCGLKTIFLNANQKPGEFPRADRIIFGMQELTAAIKRL